MIFPATTEEREEMNPSIIISLLLFLHGQKFKREVPEVSYVKKIKQVTEGKIVLDLKETDNTDYEVVEKISVNLECTGWGVVHT